MIKMVRSLFLAAGVYGMLVLAMMLFGKAQFDAVLSAPVTPQFYYGFLAVGLAWQFLILQIGFDPVRLRPAILWAAAEKLFYAVAIFWLLAADALHVPPQTQSVTIAFAVIDAVMGIAFIFAYARLGSAGVDGRGRSAV